MSTTTVEVTVEYQIDELSGYEDRFNYVSGDVQATCAVKFREVSIYDTPQGSLKGWEAYDVEITNAYMFLIDQDGGEVGETERDDMTAAEKADVKTMAIELARKQLDKGG